MFHVEHKKAKQNKCFTWNIKKQNKINVSRGTFKVVINRKKMYII